MALNKTDLLEMYRQLVLIRRFEEIAGELYTKKEIGGVYLHLANGQEGVVVGSIAALRETDHVITAYRDHGQALAVGMDTKAVMAELFGKRTGVSGGKGGSMHLASAEHRMWGGYAIVGGHLPLAAGIALKSQYTGDGDVVLCYVGDGASNNGYFHEALNMSAIWKLPIIWLIENNLYGMGTAVIESTGQPIIIKRAVSYDMHALERVDGQDTVAMYDAVSEAAEFARTNGPVMIEAMTYRYEGHGVSDRIYKEREEEMQHFRDRDPITILTNQLDEKYKDIKTDLEKITRDIEAELEEAVHFARSSDAPNRQDLFNHVYV